MEPVVRPVRHIAISADGNGRWATSRGLPRSAGHDASREAFASVLSACVELNIPYLSIHVFSSENWGRPEPEVRKLIELFSRVLELSLHDFNELGVRFRLTGSRLEVPSDLRRTVEAIEKTTSANGHVTLQFGLNYGGRKELVDAAVGLARAAMAGEIRPEEFDEETFRRHLYWPDTPDVDLFIRTGGHFRLSNFFLWQTAYAELVFTDVLWPDFRKPDLMSALELYARAERSFGNVE
ncbi:polyprenyl diphosphate synthase [Nonomuraea sp. CA-143628]|uniref:polyprenyl diphosphate synthase n=1 Tax=Nonomuraea sp. CA-143628 TaxID=3239997 RepID=UPI003D8A70EC